MNKYEAVIILNPNLSTKVDSFLKEFTSLLSGNSFNIIKTEDVGRRQLAYSINNHNKGHYLLFNIEGDPSKLIDIENKIKFPRSSNSNSNDISKLNSSFLSSIDSDKRNKNSIQREKPNINEIESILNEENSEERKGSNSFYDKCLFDEINKAKKQTNTRIGGL